GGREITHAAWYASSESDLKDNHQHNPIEYDNEIDDFSQPHFEIHHNYSMNQQLLLSNSLFYIFGNGYYEQLKQDQDLWEYGIASEQEEIFGDLVRQKKVRKNQYGIVSELNWEHEAGKLDLGIYGSSFTSKHWGEVKKLVSEEYDLESGDDYYHYTGDKSYLAVFLNENYRLAENLNLMLNLHYQMINYDFSQKRAGNFTGIYLNSYQVDYDFFNPRFGINYNLNRYFNLYGNISMAQREPTDQELYDLWDGPDDLGVQPLFSNADTLYQNGQIIGIKWSDPIVQAEKLIDYELGFGYQGAFWEASLNFFWMDFRNEIVAYGGVNNDGNPIRGNAESTVHRGIEFSVKGRFSASWEIAGDVSYNDNYFREFNPYNWSGETDDYSGNSLSGFPDILGKIKCSYRRENLLASVQLQHIGKQYLDNTEDDDRIIEAVQICNAACIWKVPELLKTIDLELNFRVNNIFDQSYYSAGYFDDWYQEKYFWPAAGRNFYVGIRAGI
ncbi:MAG: TonB-dependent receptor, partial [Candidatus Cloacimonetes bacterium]|nr:TonB-dependent receptor [Candidatus Cloacimonadota bacterium]